MAQLAGIVGTVTTVGQAALPVVTPILGAMADRHRTAGIVEDLKMRGAEAARLERARGARIVGSARTGFAKSGVQVEMGSPAEVLAEAAADVELEALRREFLHRYRSLYPKAVQSFEEPGEALFTYFQFPKQQWIHLKTTNPIESLFATVRIRTQAARRIRSRMGALCLVFQILKNSTHRLRRVRAYNLVPDTIDQLRAQHSKRRKAA